MLPFNHRTVCMSEPFSIFFISGYIFWTITWINRWRWSHHKGSNIQWKIMPSNVLVSINYTGWWGKDSAFLNGKRLHRYKSIKRLRVDVGKDGLKTWSKEMIVLFISVFTKMVTELYIKFKHWKWKICFWS